MIRAQVTRIYGARASGLPGSWRTLSRDRGRHPPATYHRLTDTARYSTVTSLPTVLSSRIVGRNGGETLTACRSARLRPHLSVHQAGSPHCRSLHISSRPTQSCTKFAAPAPPWRAMAPKNVILRRLQHSGNSLEVKKSLYEKVREVLVCGTFVKFSNWRRSSGFAENC